MRTVIVDANVWLSYLVNPHADSTVVSVIRHCLSGEVALLIPQELMIELRRTLAMKPYFQARVSSARADAFMQTLLTSVQVPPRLSVVGEYVTDPNDDYLIAYGLAYNAAYVVTGDGAVLALGQVEGMKIVNPAQFLREISAVGE